MHQHRTPDTLTRHEPPPPDQRPVFKDVMDYARDFEDEYKSSAGLKVREQTIYCVTKENPQRGAVNTTCTGPCRAERRPETCGPMMTSILSPVEKDYVVAIIQDMEMVRGEAHGTDCLYLNLNTQDHQEVQEVHPG